MSDTYEYTDIVTRVPLWASIPVADRITEADLRRRNPKPNSYMEQKIAERLALLDHPGCEIATRWLDYTNTKWAPCVFPVAEGEARCKRHGGKSASRTPERRTASAQIRALEDEVAELRSRLAASEGEAAR